MSLREEQCNKVCRILDDVLANRPTERDSLIVAVRKAFAEPKRGKWVDMGKDPATGKWDTRLHIYCSECGHRSDDKPTKYCPNCGAKMEAADGND